MTVTTTTTVTTRQSDANARTVPRYVCARTPVVCALRRRALRRGAGGGGVDGDMRERSERLRPFDARSITLRHRGPCTRTLSPLLRPLPRHSSHHHYPPGISGRHNAAHVCRDRRRCRHRTPPDGGATVARAQQTRRGNHTRVIVNHDGRCSQRCARRYERVLKKRLGVVANTDGFLEINFHKIITIELVWCEVFQSKRTTKLILNNKHGSTDHF